MYHKRDRFGALKSPALAYANFRYLRETGLMPTTHTWRDSTKAYQKKARKRKIARLSRRANRRG